MRQFIITILILFPVTIIAQSTPKETVQTYFDGYEAGDTTKLKTVFHPDFHLSWISPWHEGAEKFKQVDRKGLMSFFGPNWKSLKISSEMKDMKHEGNIAVCKAIVKLEGIVTWTDYITMMKLEDRWWIVAKVSDGVKE